MINFMKYKLVYFFISALFLLPSAYFLIRFGLKPAVDFTGGTLLELVIQPEDSREISLDEFRQSIAPIVEANSIQRTASNTFLIRAQSLDQAASAQLRASLSRSFGSVTEKSFATIGPTLGKELIKKTLFGILLAGGFILLYVAHRFKDKKYGICAILAMFHDTFILIGVFSFLGFKYNVEVDALFVTAVLTILSFSVHDTVVVYDRIRESLKHHPKLSFTQIVNQAVTETLTRSINNSLTIIFMLLALYLLGGTTTKWFVFALLVGTIAGTYSSTFTAAPLLVLWEELKAKRK
jgi:preprotein translocase subunit SecF